MDGCPTRKDVQMGRLFRLPVRCLERAERKSERRPRLLQRHQSNAQTETASTKHIREQNEEVEGCDNIRGRGAALPSARSDEEDVLAATTKAAQTTRMNAQMLKRWNVRQSSCIRRPPGHGRCTKCENWKLGYGRAHHAQANAAIEHKSLLT